jgi:hypothetical protein
MTVRTPLSRAELADLPTGAAHRVASVLTAEYPTPPCRSYLHPVLGPLTAGPGVISELADRLEEFLDEPLRNTQAGLFALASYAAALGRLTESLAELTDAVERICSTTCAPTGPPGPLPAPCVGSDEVVPNSAFGTPEPAAVRAAAQAAGLSPGEYVEVLSRSLLAAARITDSCTEIAAGLADDAAHILKDTGHFQIGEGPGSLPTLIRTLLARMDTAS